MGIETHNLLSRAEVTPLWKPRLSVLSADLAMDLGTANTLIYEKNRGVILNEPSIVAVDQKSRLPHAVGHRAKEMYGRTSSSIRCVRPLKDGVIADFDMTSLMIQYMLKRVTHRWSLIKPRLVIGVPSGITQVEKRAVIDSALRAGIREVRLVEEPMAAALGAGMPVHQPSGNMIVDIGGGTTEVAVLSLNGTAYSRSIRVAGDEMDEAIQRHLKRTFGIQVGIFEAERLKLINGSALPLGKKRIVTSYGRSITSGLPQRVEISDDDIREALQEPLASIIESITTALELTNAELSQDIMSKGIVLAGGGALLKGLAERLERETGIHFILTPDPLSCVVRGVGQIVDNLSEYKELCIA